MPDTNRVGAAALPNVGNQQSMWDMTKSVTFVASSDAEGASVATISVTAGTLVVGSVQVAYAASSASLTGTAGQKVTVYLYYYDPQLQGGSRQLRVTTNVVETPMATWRSVPYRSPSPLPELVAAAAEALVVAEGAVVRGTLQIRSK